MDITKKDENVLAGIVGAFLFSLIGGVIWFVLDLVGYVAAISGLVGAVCAVQGYRIFSGTISKKGVIIALIIALLVLVLAWYLCFTKDVYQAHQEWYESGQIRYMPTFVECFRSGHLFLQEPEVARGYYGNLFMGLAFAVLGSVRFIINAFRNAAAKKAAPEAMASYGTPSFDYTPNAPTGDIFDPAAQQSQKAEAPKEWE
ncbi:MAG: hypothetical protein IIY82_07990 [Firmicutes bacterium]|nr:hypothetical protein [Bacillota bacterium]